MSSARHRCYRCVLLEDDNPYAEMAEPESIHATRSETGEEIVFFSGYSAREIAQKRARETSGKIYVNNISKKIKRPDLTVPVAYAVAKSPVYTVRRPDNFHSKAYRAYWPPLG